jgi:hypothetical protein
MSSVGKGNGKGKGESNGRGEGRQCMDCGESLPRVEFSNSQWKKGNKNSRCILCVEDGNDDDGSFMTGNGNYGGGGGYAPSDSMLNLMASFSGMAGMSGMSGGGGGGGNLNGKAGQRVQGNVAAAEEFLAHLEEAVIDIFERDNGTAVVGSVGDDIGDGNGITTIWTLSLPPSLSTLATQVTYHRGEGGGGGRGRGRLEFCADDRTREEMLTILSRHVRRHVSLGSLLIRRFHKGVYIEDSSNSRHKCNCGNPDCQDGTVMKKSLYSFVIVKGRLVRLSPAASKDSHCDDYGGNPEPGVDYL